MKIKIIDFGFEKKPTRVHENDAGADVYATKSVLVRVGRTTKIPLGFGLEIPDGYAGYVYPRSGLSAKGITCELPPIDSGYRGEIHAIINNHSFEDYQIKKGDRVGQLVIMPIVIADFTDQEISERGVGAFGSSGE